MTQAIVLVVVLAAGQIGVLLLALGLPTIATYLWLRSEVRANVGDVKTWKQALTAVCRVLKGWQEEATDAGRERRAWRWSASKAVGRLRGPTPSCKPTWSPTSPARPPKSIPTSSTAGASPSEPTVPSGSPTTGPIRRRSTAATSKAAR